MNWKIVAFNQIWVVMGGIAAILTGNPWLILLGLVGTIVLSPIIIHLKLFDNKMESRE